MKVGLVGYHCRTGLGELNRQIYKYGDIDSWMIYPHRFKPTLKSPDRSCVISPGNTVAIWKFVESVDCLLFCETPYYESLLEIAKHLKKRIVCVPMQEWMPSPLNANWTANVDLFLCPTKHCYDQFKDSLPCYYFPWPVDVSRFPFKIRETCSRFLFMNGNGGWRGRKGSDVILSALAEWPEMPLLVRSQERNFIGELQRMKLPNVYLYGEEESNQELYHCGDVLLYPHHVDGLGLEAMEALGSGMPIISTNGMPWNEFPAIGRVYTTSIYRNMKRLVTWYNPDVRHFVEVCKSWIGKSIAHHSSDARKWAIDRDWFIMQDEFRSLVRSGKAE